MSDDTPGDKIRFDIPPRDPAGYVDQFWSGMYGNLCSFGWSEQRLILMRYSAFMIVHGIIFGFLKDSLSKPDESAWILFSAGMLGLAICSVWGFLNYCGWYNQNAFFWYAWRLKFMNDKLKLPTDVFKGETPPGPSGQIYWSA